MVPNSDAVLCSLMNLVGKLICLGGPQRGRTLTLDKGKLLVGRAPDCDIVLDDKFASRVHATITRLESSFTVEDAGSKNGVLLDNERLEKGTAAILTDGTIVTFAQTRFRFEDPSATMTNLHLESSSAGTSLVVHEATRQVKVNGRLLQPPLSAKQFELLQFLYTRQGQAISKDEIAAAVWPDEADSVPDNNIDRLVSRVRVRLAEAAYGHQFISTVRGFGFRMEDVREED